MKKDIITVKGISINVYSLNTAIVGSGAAALNAAERLHHLGQMDIAIITEGINMGTSRNTGSDKQTYYKSTLAGERSDSVGEMAKTLYDGKCMDGDIALVEAALSAQCFFRLVEIGVPFPHNRFGEYIGYKTDHDPRQRATSVGPLTSKFMTEKLECRVREKNISIFDKIQVIAILTDKEKKNVVGLLALDLINLEQKDRRYVLFNCTNVIYATGGPAGLYANSVYPESQTGSTGIAIEAGVKAKNLTEWQYGIASTKFRWNLSGTYQQVLPRYISTDLNCQDEKEFLNDYFESDTALLDAIFLKGYQWPFDPRKVFNYGSSLIDILVYNETVVKGRRVFLDFLKNPVANVDGTLDFDKLGIESKEYLHRSAALFGTPIERLTYMNQPAIELYKNNGIDLNKELLEISVCAQHNNGGLSGNIWWESNLAHFFPVGEVNGSHGVYRPGGSALNSGQVGSLRAAQFIAARYVAQPLDIPQFEETVKKQVAKRLDIGETIISNISLETNVDKIRKRIGLRTSACGAHIRSIKAILEAINEANRELGEFVGNTQISNINQLPHAFQNRDLLITQIAYLSAMADYIQNGGKSRGSYLIHDVYGNLPIDILPEDFRFSLDENLKGNLIQETILCDGEFKNYWREAREIPVRDDWFEIVWNDFRNDLVINESLEEMKNG